MKSVWNNTQFCWMNDDTMATPTPPRVARRIRNRSAKSYAREAMTIGGWGEYVMQRQGYWPVTRARHVTLLTYRNKECHTHMQKEMRTERKTQRIEKEREKERGREREREGERERERERERGRKEGKGRKGKEGKCN